MKCFHNPQKSELNKFGIFFTGTYFGLLIGVICINVITNFSSKNYNLMNLGIIIFI